MKKVIRSFSNIVLSSVVLTMFTLACSSKNDSAEINGNGQENESVTGTESMPGAGDDTSLSKEVSNRHFEKGNKLL